MHCYSDFWLGYAGGWLRLSAIWADRELALMGALERAYPDQVEAVEPVPAAEMHAWLRLPDHERNDQVEAYAGRRPLSSIHQPTKARGRTRKEHQHAESV